MIFRRARFWMRDRVQAALFLLALTVPPILMWTREPLQTLAENRAPAPPPTWKVSRNFPHQFDSYFRDRFGLRDELVHAHNWLKVHFFDVSPATNVLLGKEDWLYYSGEETLYDFQGRRPLNEDQLKAWCHALEHRRDRLAERGIRYLFVVAPNKQTIYPEHLPDEWNRPGRTRLDQLVAHMRAHSDLEILDLRPALFQAKQHEQVYSKTDSHWSDRGLYMAYEQIHTTLAASFPPARPWPRSDYFDALIPTNGGDLNGMLGLTKPLEEEWAALYPLRPRIARIADAYLTDSQKSLSPYYRPDAYEIDDLALPKAVVLHDSFGVALRPFMAPHFRRVLFLWQRHLESTILDREQPDVVIQEICERFLWDPRLLGTELD